MPVLGLNTIIKQPSVDLARHEPVCQFVHNYSSIIVVIFQKLRLFPEPFDREHLTHSRMFVHHCVLTILTSDYKLQARKSYESES